MGKSYIKMIRKLKTSDIPVILQWYNWYIENSTSTFETVPVSLQEFTSRLNNITQTYPCLVLEEDHKLIGYAYISQFNEKQAYDCTVDLTIYLDPQARKHGYGSILMREIITYTKQLGYKNIVSLITADNTPSIHLHEKFGFVFKGRLENIGYKFNKWLDLSYYYLQLEGNQE